MTEFSDDSLMMSGTREQRALIALSMLDRQLPAAFFDEVFSARLDWPWIIMQAMHQRVLCYVWENLKRWNLIGPAARSGLVKNWITYMDQLSHANLEKNTLWLNLLRRTIDAVNRAGIPIACIKGSALIGDIYHPGNRMLGDVDTLIPQSAAAEVSAVLNELGFIQGTVNFVNNTVEPLSREKIRFWNFNAHIMAKFTLLTNHPSVPFFRFAAGFDFFDPHDIYSFPSDAVLSRRVPKSGDPIISIPDEADMVLNLCIHIYREAVSAIFAASADNWHLGKFSDLRNYLLKHDSETLRSAVKSRVAETHLEKPYYFALHYTQAVYGDFALAPWADLVDPGDGKDFIYEMLDGERRVMYRAPFSERLFDTAGTEIPGLDPAWKKVMTDDAW